ncbi:MAG: hypothetical protein RIB98_15965 [Acidimicrobiales bacterium]
MTVAESDDRDRPADADIDVIDVEFVATDLSLAGLLRIDIRRPARATRFLASILRPGLEPVTVLDYDLPLATGAFEFRSSGVWVELCCEAPLDHWTVGLEAFGLALPEKEVVTPSSFGDRVPIGLDLDLDTIAAPEGDARAFSIEVDVHGEVLVADQSYELAATGTRRRNRNGNRRTHPQLQRWGQTPVPTGQEMQRGSDPGVPTLGELTVAWPVEDGQPSPGLANIERRGWVGGSRPGWFEHDTPSGPTQAAE